MSKLNGKNIFNEQICHVCGKKYFRPVETIYKYRENGDVKYACSYSCWVKKRKELGTW